MKYNASMLYPYDQCRGVHGESIRALIAMYREGWARAQVFVVEEGFLGAAAL